MEKKIETKEMLIKDFLEATSDNVPKRTALIKRFNKYLSKETDPMLSAMLQIIKIFEFDDHSNNTKKCCEMAVQIFEYLDTLDEYERIDLAIFSRVICYHADYSKAYELFNKVLKILSERRAGDTGSPSYNGIYINLHYNFTNGTLRAKFYDKNVDEKLLEATFMKCYDLVMEVCKQKNKLPQMYTLELRRGLFYQNISMVQNGLNQLRGTKDTKRIRAARHEIADYVPHIKGDFGTDLRHIIVGYQIQKRYNELGWKRKELAEKLDIDYERLCRIINGTESFAIGGLMEAAKVLGVSTGYLLGEETVKLADEDESFMWDMQTKMRGSTDIEKAAVLEAAELMLNFLRKKRD